MEREPEDSRPIVSKQGEDNIDGSINSDGKPSKEKNNEPESAVFSDAEQNPHTEQPSESVYTEDVSSEPDTTNDFSNATNDSNLSPEQTIDYSHNQSEGSESYSGEYPYNSYNGDSGSGGEPPTENNESPDENNEPEDEEGGPIKPFLEHLEDLRWTLVKSVVAVLLGMLICLVAGRYLVAVLMWPLEESGKLFISSKDEVTIMLGTNVVARGNSSNLGITNIFGSNYISVLHIIPVQVGTNTILALQPSQDEKPPQNPMVVIKNYSPIEGIMVALKLALFGGLVVSFPFIIYFIGQFVLPALHVNEKKILFKAVGFSGGLFLLGVAFCYFIVMVFALGATVQFSQWLGFAADEWRADAYLSFVVKFMLGMGLSFQMPVVILLLVKIGLLDYEKLKKFRTYAFVANLAISAVVTPSGDPFTMLIMALPLHGLYEISVFIAWYWERKKLKKKAAEEQS